MSGGDPSETPVPSAEAEQDVILLVDDTPTNLQVLFQILNGAGRGYRLLVAKSGEAALKSAAIAHPSLILLDIMMPPGIDGYETCRRLKASEETRDAAVIFLSALDDTEAKVKGLQAGAVDYVSKPFAAEEVLARVETHLTIQRLHRRLQVQNAALEHELQVARELVQEAKERLEGPLLGDGPAVRQLRAEVSQAAQGDHTVLLVSGPGAGQEAVARAIHDQSQRRHRPFLTVDCLTVKAGDQDALFGTKGRLLGLLGAGTPGRWGLCDGGTIWFERVEALPAVCQEHLALKLGALHKARQKGGKPPQPDPRVIIHSSLDLSDPAASSGVDEQLRALLVGDPIRIPALKDRREDLPALVEHYVQRRAQRLGKRVEAVSKGSLQRLAAYSWPGNLDELLGVVECAVVVASGPVVEVDPSLLDPGKRVGSYQLERKLGAGAMGEVWLARHRLLVRPAAVKLVQAGRLTPEEREQALGRFEREAKATARLESPHTVRLYDFGLTDEGAFYYVMERLRGLDLESLVKRFGPLPPERVVWFLEQACGSLAEAHQEGMVHRDIKPANLFTCRLGPELDQLKVLDFGMVRTASAQEANLTGASILGTPAYMAPEVCRGEQDVDGRADLYSLGCAAYWLLSQAYLFNEANVLQLLLAHTNKPPRPLRQTARQPVPPALEALITRCLAKERDQRPATAQALREELGALDLGARWTPARAAAWWREHLADV